MELDSSYTPPYIHNWQLCGYAEINIHIHFQTDVYHTIEINNINELTEYMSEDDKSLEIITSSIKPTDLEKLQKFSTKYIIDCVEIWQDNICNTRYYTRTEEYSQLNIFHLYRTDENNWHLDFSK